MPAILLLSAFLCAGCASPGPPKPPSLQLPQRVNDLSAERVGGRVVLRWTTPSRTTDDLEIKGAMTAELCRETGTTVPARAARPSASGVKPAACTPVGRLAVAPGASETADSLPPALQAGPAVLLAYRIQIFNAAGRSAGTSAPPAYAASGPAPAGVASLRATASEQGAVLEWESIAAPAAGPAEVIDFKRLDLSVPPPERKAAPSQTRPSRKSSAQNSGRGQSASRKNEEEDPRNQAHLRAPDTASAGKPGVAGTVDTTAAMGNTYSYTAQRVRALTIDNHELEIASGPSAPVTLAMRDTFPPRPPTGLAAISGSIAPASAGAKPRPYIDLSWEPNTETDLAGYRVYRQLARADGTPQGPLARLTPLPIAVPAYRDVAVRPGQGYIYSVTAVDAAGNESAPSAKALEAVSNVLPE